MGKTISKGSPGGDSPHPSTLIDALLKDCLAPILKEAGFRKSGGSFWRETGHVTDVINLQKSQWNDASKSTFYINLGVYWKEFQMAIGQTCTGRFPREYHCTVFRRIGTPDDSDWDLFPDSNLHAMNLKLATSIRDTALPWLANCHNADFTLSWLKKYRTGRSNDFEKYLRK